MSLQEQDVQSTIDLEHDKLVRRTVAEAKQQLECLLETASLHSNSSRHSLLSRRSMRYAQSNSSSVSVTAAKARADAKDERTRSAYSGKEAEVKLQRARMKEKERIAALRKVEWAATL